MASLVETLSGEKKSEFLFYGYPEIVNRYDSPVDAGSIDTQLVDQILVTKYANVYGKTPFTD